MGEETTGSAQWRRTLLGPDATLREAISNLNDSGMQIVLLVSDDGTLIGTLTDGDIRRAFLKGLDMTSSVETVVQKEALVVPPELGRDMVLQLMRANSVHQMPVVDDRRRVVGLHLWKQFIAPSSRSNLIVIMAGGRGARLQPHTDHTPKPLLPVAGKPLLEHIIGRAKAEGFGRFTIAIQYLGHMIEDYFGDGSRWGVEIAYLREQTPLGTVGGVGLLDPRPTKAFVVSNGDVITDIRYGELLDFHSAHGAAATMAVRAHEWQHPFGVVQTEGVDIVGFVEKPVTRSHVNTGVYVLEPASLDLLVRSEPCDMPTLFNRLRERGARTIAYPIHEPWLDVGRPDDYQRAGTSLKVSNQLEEANYEPTT